MSVCANPDQVSASSGLPRIVCTTPATPPLLRGGPRGRSAPAAPLALSLAPVRLREDDLLGRRGHLRQDDLGLAALPLGEQECLPRRARLVPTQRAENRAHRMAVQVVLDLVLVDLADLPDRRLEHLRGRERIGCVLSGDLPLVLLLVRLQELLVPRVVRPLRRGAPADGVEDPLG